MDTLCFIVRQPDVRTPAKLPHTFVPKISESVREDRSANIQWSPLDGKSGPDTVVWTYTGGLGVRFGDALSAS